MSRRAGSVTMRSKDPTSGMLAGAARSAVSAFARGQGPGGERVRNSQVALVVFSFCIFIFRYHPGCKSGQPNPYSSNEAGSGLLPGVHRPSKHGGGKKPYLMEEQCRRSTEVLMESRITKGDRSSRGDLHPSNRDGGTPRQ